jgi:hypothetical protein
MAVAPRRWFSSRQMSDAAVIARIVACELSRSIKIAGVYNGVVDLSDPTGNCRIKQSVLDQS